MPPFCGERPKDGLVGRLLEIWSERAQCELSGGECPTDPVPVAAGFDAVATPAVLYHRKRRNLLSLKTKLKGGFYMGIPLKEITLSAIPGSGSGFKVEIILNEGVKTVKAILTRHRYWQQRIDDSIEMSRGLMGASIKPKGRVNSGLAPLSPSTTILAESRRSIRRYDAGSQRNTRAQDARPFPLPSTLAQRR